MKKIMKRMAMLLSLALVMTTVFSGSSLSAKADGETPCNISVALTVESGEAADNYNINIEQLESGGGHAFSTDSASISVGKSKASDSRYVDIASHAVELKFTARLAGHTLNSITIAGHALTEAEMTNFTNESVGYILDLSTGIPAEIAIAMNITGGSGGSGGPGPDGPGPGRFDGKAFFVWRGENDKVCSSLLELDPGEGSPFDTVYVPIASVKDGDEQYDIANRDYYWLWHEKDAEDFINAHKAEGFDYNSFNEALRDETLRRSVAIDPCGAEDGANSICTNGDRQFRAAIITEEYEALEFSNDSRDYQYFPSFWDPTFFTNVVDISDTKGAGYYEAFLTEPTIRFKVNAHSAKNIKGVKALDVTPDAVSVAKSGEYYEITYSSNYFDNVMFELTAEDDTVYHLQLVRTALQVHDNFGPEGDNSVTAELYYDADDTYENYEAYATICYTDGTTEFVAVPSSEVKMDIAGNPVAPGIYEIGGGEHLKMACYTVELKKNAQEVEGIAFNVVAKGAMTGESYGGSYLGSGTGAFYNIEERRVIYEIQ